MLTIVIPTHNRYPYLERLLRYLSEVKNSYPVFILDSTNNPTSAGALIPVLLNNSLISYTRYDPEISPIEKLKDGLARVKTPYVLTLADDDFSVPSIFAEGINFLESHHSFSVVHGVSGIFSIHQKGSEHKVRLASYPQRTIIDDKGECRLLNHMSRYSTTFYSIHRTQNLKKNVDICYREKFGWQFAELFLGCLDVIQGKTYTLPRLYMLREVHSGADSWNTEIGRTKDLFDWIAGPDFSTYYPRFRDQIAEELQRVDGLFLNEGREIVKQSMWLYLSNVLPIKYEQHFKISQSSSNVQRIRHAMKHMPGILRVRDIFKSFRINHISLPSLFNSRSPYHKDFMPIYRSITGFFP